MTHTLHKLAATILVFLFAAGCGQAPDTAEIQHQEVSMARNAADHLAELQHELDEVVKTHGELSNEMQQEWNQAKSDFLSASGDLQNAEADNLEAALSRFNSAKERMHAVYHSIRRK